MNGFSTLPEGRPIIDGEKVRGDFNIQINGQNVYFDKNGFPDFTPISPGQDYAFINNNLTGQAPGDMRLANMWAESKKLPNFKTLDNGQCEINGVLHTWHHHQDGKTMFPVPSSIHNNVRHSGGKAVITRSLQGFFDGPSF